MFIRTGSELKTGKSDGYKYSLQRGPKWRSSLMAAIIVALAVMSVVAQAQNPAYLKEFPSVDQVLKAETNNDPKLTALLQMTALSELSALVKILAGPRQFREINQDEGRLMGAYNAAQYKIGADSDTTWPGPQGNWKRFSLGINDHYYSPADPRFGSDTQLFQKLLPVDIRTRLADELTREGQVHEAFLKKQAEEDAQFKAAQAQAQNGSSPLNLDPINKILGMKGSEGARRCLELGHTPMECATNGFMGGIAALGADMGRTRMSPGLSMTGIYKASNGPVIDFENSAQLGSCGQLVTDSHPYSVEPGNGQILIQVESKPQPFTLAMGADGRLSGPGTIAVDGKIVVGYKTVYVPASPDPAPYGTPAHNASVAIYAPKTEHCQIGLLSPAGSSVTLGSATVATFSIFGQSTGGGPGDKAPPPGLRLGGEYAGQGGLKITFEIGDAILDCGEAHVARPYTVQNLAGQIVVTVQNGGVNVPLSIQPNGSLNGSGTVDVAGRLLTGMTSTGPAFVPKNARCAVGTLTLQ